MFIFFFFFNITRGLIKNKKNQQQSLSIKNILQIQLLLKYTLTLPVLGLHPVGKHWALSPELCQDKPPLWLLCQQKNVCFCTAYSHAWRKMRRIITRHLHTKITTRIAISGFIFEICGSDLCWLLSSKDLLENIWETEVSWGYLQAIAMLLIWSAEFFAWILVLLSKAISLFAIHARSAC